MNHPNSEEWALFVSEKMPSQESRALSDHLRDCAVCTAEVAALQRSRQRLIEWQFPEPERMPGYWAAPMIKWGIAAAVVLGVGFGLGRFSPASGRDMARMRAEIEASARALLAEDLRQALGEAQEQSKEALKSMEARLGETSDEQMTRVVRNVVAAVTSVREEDRAATRALIEEVRRQHETEIRRVRADLETVATHADDELRFAHFQLHQLTAKTEK
jgi:hypothetical protein